MMHRMVKVSDIIRFLDDEVIAVLGLMADDLYIDNIPDANTVEDTSLDWVNSSKENKQKIAENSRAKVVIVDESIQYSPIIKAQNKVLLVVKEPRKTMARIASHFFVKRQSPGIHISAVVDPNAIIDGSSHIGAGCVVGKAKIGAVFFIQNGVDGQVVETAENTFLRYAQNARHQAEGKMTVILQAA